MLIDYVIILGSYNSKFILYGNYIVHNLTVASGASSINFLINYKHGLIIKFAMNLIKVAN